MLGGSPILFFRLRTLEVNLHNKEVICNMVDL